MVTVIGFPEVVMESFIPYVGAFHASHILKTPVLISFGCPGSWEELRCIKQSHSLIWAAAGYEIRQEFMMFRE